MGALLAKFKKQKTTTEILEKLEDEIQEMEKFSVNTQAKLKRFVANFLAISIGLYTLGFIIFYFVFFPPTWTERLTYSIPLLVFPWIIIMMRKALSWFFQRRLLKNSNKLSILREEKKKILEKVMDNETYKVAVNLLNRFGEKSNGTRSVGGLTPRASSMILTSNANSNQLTPSTSRRNISFNVTPQQQQQNFGVSGSNLRQFMSPYDRSFQTVRRRTPFPIINQQNKTALEKMVDYLVGDGLQNRFAMICKECFSHNGMALQEEFEYATFRCAFCNALNPSRKARPIAPKLPSQSTPLGTAIRSESSASSSAPSSSGESDAEIRNSENLGTEKLKAELESKKIEKLINNETSDSDKSKETLVLEARDEKTSQEIVNEKNKTIIGDEADIYEAMIHDATLLKTPEKSEDHQNNS